MICLLFGCETKDNINKDTEQEIKDIVSQMNENETIKDDVSQMNENETIKDDVSQMNESESIKENAPEISLEPVTCDAEQIKSENNFSISVDSKDGKILLFDTKSQKELTSFEESYGPGSMFLSMIDENSGVFLYCSTPAGGMMMKQLYITSDRWQTYSQMDIGSLIDGYPNSLYAQSDTCFYIGTPTRNVGYMFETIDGGKNWYPVIIDKEIKHCRTGYAPILNSEEGTFYVLLEFDDFYSLYKLDDALSAWEQLGTFSREGPQIKSYFIWDGKIIVTDYEDQHYQLSFVSETDVNDEEENIDLDTVK